VIEAGLPLWKVKKEQNGRKSLRRLKPTVGCNAIKRRRRRRIIIIIGPWWALALLRSFAHSSLSRATFFQF